MGPNGTANSTCQWAWSSCPAEAPFIDHVTPSSVHVQVPTTITMYGTGFQSVNNVMMCGYMASSLYYSSSTGVLTFSVPTSLSGGSVCSVIAYSNSIASNTNVTISVASDSCTSSYSSCSSCTGASPCGYCASAGNGICATGNQTGPASFYCSQWAWSGSSCSIVGPTITSISPTYVTELSGTYISIYGTNFVSTPSVSICGYLVSNVNYYSSTSLSVTLPDSVTSGSCYVRVTNPGGQMATASTMLTVSSASVYISSISPSSGSSSGGTYLTIYGSGFRSGASVTVCGWTCYSVYVSDHSTISCTTPYIGDDSDYCDVKVTNPNGRSATDYSAFYIYDYYGGVGPIVGITVGVAGFVAGMIILIIVIQRRQRLIQVRVNAARGAAPAVPRGVTYQALPSQPVPVSTWAPQQGGMQPVFYAAQQQPGGPVVYYQLPPGAMMPGATMAPGPITTMPGAAPAPAPTAATPLMQSQPAGAPMPLYYPTPLAMSQPDQAHPQPMTSFVSAAPVAPTTTVPGMSGAATL